jgi:hypothetical protein
MGSKEWTRLELSLAIEREREREREVTGGMIRT